MSAVLHTEHNINNYEAWKEEHYLYWVILEERSITVSWLVKRKDTISKCIYQDTLANSKTLNILSVSLLITLQEDHLILTGS